MKRNIKISGISDATTLVTKASAVEGDVTITRGRYSIDAKSIMGVFSIDLSDLTPENQNTVKIYYSKISLLTMTAKKRKLKFPFSF